MSNYRWQQKTVRNVFVCKLDKLSERMSYLNVVHRRILIQKVPARRSVVCF